MSRASMTNHDQGWIKFHRGPFTNEMLKDKVAFNLLSQIALRARRSGTPNLNGLKSGEAMLGDPRNQGITRSQYRPALKKLVKLKLVEVISKSYQGTIVKLINKEIFDINEAYYADTVHHPEASSSPPDDHLIATNKNTNKDKKEKKVRRQKEDEDNFVLTPKTYGCENHGLKSSESIIGRIDFDSISAKYCDD